MFEKEEELTYEQHLVSIIQKKQVALGFQLQYALGEGHQYVTHDTYIEVGERFRLQTEFYTTGKITINSLQLYTGREEKEVLEPVAIRFLPVESSYIKTGGVIQIPSILEPRLVWSRGEFDRWCRESTKMKYQLLSPVEVYKTQVEIAQQYGMKLKAH